mmetsp:Transcript_10835/g.20268  ORF Transcript_10835/g.20268 Transcript_10835/m.20268 type:complete len:617 (-) Transcript_10835:2405-4255(-)
MSSNNVEEREGNDPCCVEKDELSTTNSNGDKSTTVESRKTDTANRATSTSQQMIGMNAKDHHLDQNVIVQDTKQQISDRQVNSHAASAQGVKSKNEVPLPDWHEILKDATELESLIFCVSRSSARDKLFKLVDNLKQLSGKLKRYEDVTFKIKHKSSSTDFLKKRSFGDYDLSEDDHISSKSKKPRAISFQGTNNHVINRSSDSSQIKNEKGENMLHSLMPQSLDPTAQAPLLKNRDKWVQHHRRPSNMHCPDFEASNRCPLGANCDFWHVFMPKKPNVPIEKDGSMVKLTYTKEDVERAYLIYRKITLCKNDYFEKIKNNELNLSNYCFAIKCPLDHTIYYAQPFPGDRNVKANKSSQGIWWYINMKDAKDAVATQVIFDLKERGIIPVDFMPFELESDAEMGQMNAVNKATEMSRLAVIVPDSSRMKEKRLPDIIPLNYMESNYQQRCAQFNTPQGCPRSSRCQYAHVYYPSEVNSKEFPDKEALVHAYKENFQILLQDPFFLGLTNGLAISSPFRVMTAVDDSGGLWYTAAMKCPYEGIIYYAAGGVTGQVNTQNIVLYPSPEDAKLALAGIVLDSFRKRGLIGHRKNLSLFNRTEQLPNEGKSSVFPLAPLV